MARVSEDRLTFDPKYHAYWWDGDQYIPSVTQILDDSGHVSKFCKSKTHADRGTEIHEMINLEIKRLMDGRSVQGKSKFRLADLTLTYPAEFSQFTDFHTDLDIQFTDTEVKTHGSIGILEHVPGPYKPDWAGTADFFGVFRKTGEELAGDVKSGLTPPPHARLQLAAYTLAHKPMNYAEVQRGALTLHANKKTYKWKAYQKAEDFQEWIEQVKRYKRNNPH